MLGGLHIFPRSGQIVTLQRGSQRSQFRVIWTKQIGPDEIRAGIESVAGEVDLWGLELPDRIAATPDQHTQPGIPPDPRRARLQLVQPRLRDLRWGSLRAVVRWAVPSALSVVIASLALIGQRSAVRAPGPAAPRWMQAQLAPPLIRYSPAPSTGDHMLILTSQHSAGSRLQVEEAPLGRLTFPSPPTPNAFGVVHLTVVIGTNGRVKNVRLSGGSLTLARAAVQAIRTWKYARTSRRETLWKPKARLPSGSWATTQSSSALFLRPIFLPPKPQTRILPTKSHPDQDWRRPEIFRQELHVHRQRRFSQT